MTEPVTEEVVVRQKKPRSEAQRAQFEAARLKAYEMRKQYAAARKERDTQAVLTVLQDGELKPTPPTEAPVTEAPTPITEAPTAAPATEAPATAAPEDEPEEEVVQISRSAKPKKKVSRRKIVVVEQSSSSSESEVEVVVPKRPPPAAQPSAQEMMVQRMTSNMFYL